MKKIFLITSVFLLLSSLLVYSKNLEGKWTITDMKVSNDEKEVSEMEDVSMVWILAQPAYFTFKQNKLVISDNENVELQSIAHTINGDKIEIKTNDAKIEKGTIKKMSDNKLLLDFGTYQYEIQKL